MDYKAAAVMMLAKADEKQTKLIYEILARLVNEPVKEEPELKTGFDIMSEVEDAIIHLEELPDVIQLLIENLKLDERNITKDDEYDLINRRGMIYNVLTLVQRTIWETNDSISAITLKKAQTTTASTDQSN